jgi:predicted aspartyl protease
LSPLPASPRIVLAAPAAEANSVNRWLFALACLSLFCPRTLQAEGSALPFRLTAGYLIQVEGRIGDQAHLKFILDTGATISMVDQRVAAKLKLERNTANSFNFDRKLEWDQATAPEVEFGPVRATSVLVLVGDLAHYSEFAGKVDAIIGMDLLQLSNVVVDFGARVLRFDPTSQKAYAAGGDPMAKCLILALPVQDHLVHLIVDTGLQGILLYEERLRKNVPGVRVTGSVRNATMGGRMQVKQATLPDVVFGSKHREVRVLLAPSPAADTLPGIDGIVGIDALEAHRVHFDFSQKSLSWE